MNQNPPDALPNPLFSSRDGRFVVVRSEPWMAEHLEAVQVASFPTLAREELMHKDHYLAHLEIFPEGQHAVLERDTRRVVAASTDFRTDVDFEHYQHRYIEIVDGNWLGNHQADGEWLYGADIGVMPEYRGFGLSSLLYRARHELIRRLGLKGHVAGAMPKGYGAVQHELSLDAYLEEVWRGERSDTILNVMRKRGYAMHGVMSDYVDDPSCANYGVFMVWRNPDA